MELLGRLFLLVTTFLTFLLLINENETVFGANTSRETIDLRWYQCPSKIITVAAAKLDNFDKYPFREVGLSIYQNLKIPCDGVLVQWNFLTSLETVWGLHLAVFRPIDNGLRFMMIGETYVNGVTFVIGDGVKMTDDGGAWVSYRPEEELEVEAGDVIGVFYDADTVRSSDVAICTTTRHLFPRGAASEHDNNAVVLLYSAEELADSNYIVVKKTAISTSRYAALSAFVTSHSAGREFLSTRDDTPPPLITETTTPISSTTMTTTSTQIKTTTATPVRTPEPAVARAPSWRYTLKPPPQIHMLPREPGNQRGVIKSLIHLDHSGELPPAIADTRCWGLPKMVKACHNWVKRFYYDAASHNCLQYLSCNSSFFSYSYYNKQIDTTFQTRADCLRTCWQYKSQTPPEITITSSTTTTSTSSTTSTTTTKSTTESTTSSNFITPQLVLVPLNIDMIENSNKVARAKVKRRTSARRRKMPASLLVNNDDPFIISYSSLPPQLQRFYYAKEDIPETTTRPQIARLIEVNRHSEGKILPLDIEFMPSSGGDSGGVDEDNDAGEDEQAGDDNSSLMPTFILQSLPERRAFFLKNARR